MWPVFRGRARGRLSGVQTSCAVGGRMTEENNFLVKGWLMIEKETKNTYFFLDGTSGSLLCRLLKSIVKEHKKYILEHVKVVKDEN
jgi:hypothetical protein